MSQYLIAHIGHTAKSSEHIIWWKPNSRGYTVCIDKAGLYDESEARSICQNGVCIAVPTDAARPLSRSTPYYRRSNGFLAKLYDGDDHTVVPNEFTAWKALLEARLMCCERPDKPTPIGAKARSIYLGNEGGAA